MALAATICATVLAAPPWFAADLRTGFIGSEHCEQCHAEEYRRDCRKPVREILCLLRDPANGRQVGIGLAAAGFLPPTGRRFRNNSIYVMREEGNSADNTPIIGKKMGDKIFPVSPFFYKTRICL